MQLSLQRTPAGWANWLANFQLIQTPNALAIFGEYMGQLRLVHIGNGTTHAPAAVREWNGDSVGHWEGNTLVVETTNFHPAVISPDGLFASGEKRVVERFTRTGPNEITYQFLVSNPVRYSQSWRGEMILHSTRGPIYEYACHEGNYALHDVLEAARRADVTKGSQNMAR